MILFVANAVSELMRPAPDATVSGWVKLRVIVEMATPVVRVAEICAGIACMPAGRSIGAIDLLICATARVRSLDVATRNVRDFEDCGVRVINPWLAPTRA